MPFSEQAWGIEPCRVGKRRKELAPFLCSARVSTVADFFQEAREPLSNVFADAIVEQHTRCHGKHRQAVACIHGMLRLEQSPRKLHRHQAME